MLGFAQEVQINRFFAVVLTRSSNFVHVTGSKLLRPCRTRAADALRSIRQSFHMTVCLMVRADPMLQTQSLFYTAADLKWANFKSAAA